MKITAYGIMARKLGFPNVLMYVLPKALLLESSVKEVGYQQYRWLNFYFCVSK